MGKGGMGACSGGGVLFELKNIHSHNEKIAFLEEAMNGCASYKIKKAKEAGEIPKKGNKKSKGEKIKKRMSGYNCFMKECAKKTGDFQNCLSDKGWAKLNDSEKEKYNKMASDGCEL